jgi:ATP-dependent Clp protease, protease subunit
MPTAPGGDEGGKDQMPTKRASARPDKGDKKIEPDPLLLADDDDDDDDEDDHEEVAKAVHEEPKLVEKFLKARTILISEPITSELAKRVYQSLILLESEDAEKPITLIVNSPGGEADTGFGIYDMIRFVRPQVRTLVAGLCASAAVMVFLAADKEQRYSLPNSRFLLHQPSSATFGQASDLEIASREILKLRDRYNEIVAHETGRTLEKITEDADRDFWMSAQDAAEYGLVSRVITHRAELD